MALNVICKTQIQSLNNCGNSGVQIKVITTRTEEKNTQHIQCMLENI